MSVTRAALVAIALVLALAELIHPTRFAEKRVARVTTATLGSGLDANVLDSLPPIDVQALGSIDFVQFERRDKATPVGPHVLVPIDAQVVLLGWCGDPDTRSAGAGAFLSIDGRTRIDTSASLGGYRPDVATVLSSPKLDRSGFRIALDASAIGPGTHELQFGVIASDRRGYFTLGGPIDITIADAPTHS